MENLYGYQSNESIMDNNQELFPRWGMSNTNALNSYQTLNPEFQNELRKKEVDATGSLKMMLSKPQPKL